MRNENYSRKTLRHIHTPFPYTFLVTYSGFYLYSCSIQILAKKMTVLYKLAREQLSKQSHYDFGLRALKSVLVMAGELKRDSPDLKEVETKVHFWKFMQLTCFNFTAKMENGLCSVMGPRRGFSCVEELLASPKEVLARKENHQLL